MPIHTEQLGLMLIISDVIGQLKAFPNNSCVSRTELKSFPKCILFPRESRLLSHEFMILFIFPRSFTKIVCHFSHSISSEISVFFFFSTADFGEYTQEHLLFATLSGNFNLLHSITYF